jgi:hypothetical protein
MMGTFGGALEARHIDASGGRLRAEVVGEVEQEEGVLVIRRIHVAMRLEAPEQARETDGQQQEHFAHDEPDDGVGLCAEREPDAEFLPVAGGVGLIGGVPLTSGAP